MKVSTYKKIQQSAIKYYNSLDLKTVTLEFTRSGLLNQNSKLSKGSNPHIYGLELVPSNILGDKHNFCGRETSCKFACLFFSGIQNLLKTKELEQGKLTPVLKKRIRRAFLWLESPDLFYSLLSAEIKHKDVIAELEGFKAYFRLNVFSDIDFRPFIDSMPKSRFYDYTKYWERTGLPNYKLTYSGSEKTGINEIIERVEQGHNVAVVLPKIPRDFHGLPVISGDESDDRSNDPAGHVVVLRPKATIKQKEKKNNFINAMGGK